MLAFLSGGISAVASYKIVSAPFSFIGIVFGSMTLVTWFLPIISTTFPMVFIGMGGTERWYQSLIKTKMGKPHDFTEIKYYTMEAKTVSTRMQSLLLLYDMQTIFFVNAIEGISDKDTHNRLNTKANHIAWLIGSLVEQRCEIARNIGIETQQTAHELFKDGKGIQDNISYPELTQYKKDWDAITPITRHAFVEASDEKLDIKIQMGGMEMTLFDMITFSIYREANCIGQIALWRRLLGYEAMKYE